jgi:hypothetical protein
MNRMFLAALVLCLAAIGTAQAQAPGNAGRVMLNPQPLPPGRTMIQPQTNPAYGKLAPNKVMLNPQPLPPRTR